MNIPRICIVGAGNLSSRRIYPYIGSAGASITGICDLDQNKATRNSQLFGGNVYSDMELMLQQEQPDGVIICTGPRGHPNLAIRAMHMGFPVYTEKPPALTAAETLEVAKVSAETGILCTTAFKKRYATAYDRAHKWLQEFHDEARLSLSVDFCSAPYPDGETLFDFAIHQIDLAHYLFGDVQKVFCFSRQKRAYAISLQFANGAVGSFNFNDGRSWAVPTETVELTLDNGHFMTIQNSSSWEIAKGDKGIEWRRPPTFTSAGDSGNDTGHFSEIFDFVSAIRDKRHTSRSSIYESYKTMVLYEAIQQSATTGKIVAPIYQTLPSS